MNTPEYLAALRSKLGAPSDYALIPILGITRQTMTNYRQGRTAFDDRVSMRVAELLEVPPARVLVDMAAERASVPEVRAVWRDAASRLSVFVMSTGALVLSRVQLRPGLT